MSLIVEIFQKIRFLLDKPVSPLAKSQIIQLINKQVVPSDDLLSLFTRKFRADLVLYLLNSQTVTTDKMQSTLTILVQKLLQFKIEDAASIWKNILGREQLKNFRQQWTEKLLRESLKNTNESLKSAQLTLLKQNCKLLWQWNQGRIFEQFTKNYCRSFVKFNIYLPEYPQLLSLLISKAEGVKNNLIDNELRKELIVRLIQFMNNTRNKQSFAFQNECLKAFCKILQSNKTKMNDLLILHSGDKALEDYLWKKPTREQAYKCKEAIKKVGLQIKAENEQKMVRNYQSKIYQTEEPLLIEQVIDKANQYRKNNHLMIGQYQSAKIQRNSFLRKGKGNGGGKSSIISPTKPNKDSMYELDKLDQLVESCFKKSNQSFIPKEKRVQQSFDYSIGASTITIEDDKQFCEISNLIDLAYQFKFGQQLEE